MALVHLSVRVASIDVDLTGLGCRNDYADRVEKLSNDFLGDRFLKRLVET